jgi:hypothetical protein
MMANSMVPFDPTVGQQYYSTFGHQYNSTFDPFHGQQYSYDQKYHEQYISDYNDIDEYNLEIMRCLKCIRQCMLEIDKHKVSRKTVMETINSTKAKISKHQDSVSWCFEPTNFSKQVNKHIQKHQRALKCIKTDLKNINHKIKRFDDIICQKQIILQNCENWIAHLQSYYF